MTERCNVDALGRESPEPVLLRFKGTPVLGGKSKSEGRSGDEDLFVGGVGTERMLVKDVNLGRMYDRVDGCGGVGGGGVGGGGGGNHVCRDSRARSDVTCR